MGNFIIICLAVAIFGPWGLLVIFYTVRRVVGMTNRLGWVENKLREEYIMMDTTEYIITEAGFTEAVNRVKRGECPFCCIVIANVKFRDELSVEESKISGLCQSCQDEIFGDE